MQLIFEGYTRHVIAYVVVPLVVGEVAFECFLYLSCHGIGRDDESRHRTRLIPHVYHIIVGIGKAVSPSGEVAQRYSLAVSRISVPKVYYPVVARGKEEVVVEAEVGNLGAVSHEFLSAIAIGIEEIDVATGSANGC